MLITEAEAGRDIKRFLHLAQPKPPIPEKPEQPKAAAAAVGPKTGSQQQATALSAKPDLSSAVEHEEPEEVLVVEPLDAPLPASLDAKLSADDLGFLADMPSEQPSVELETEERPFSLEDSFVAPVESPEAEAHTAEDPFAIVVPTFEAETGDFGEPQPEKQADDFTTDTLAELYIAQGFFEKAVDIYERMLVDKPNSQGLKDKLSKVRAMAAAAGPAEESDAESDELISAELIPESNDPEVLEPEVADVDAFVPPAHDAGQPRLDDFELTETMPSFPDEGSGAPHPVKQASQPKHFNAGFEPREYIPPDAIPRQATPAARPASPLMHEKQEKEPVDQTAEQMTFSARKSPASRKETVDRLENWLKNIMKES